MTSHRCTSLVLPALTAVALTSLAAAQTAAPHPGLRVFGGLTSTDTELMDPNGNVVHTWPSAYPAGTGVYVQPDGLLLRAIMSSTQTIPVGGIGGGVQRQTLDGTVVWDFRYDTPAHVSHHDLELLPNGNVLMIAWETKSTAETIAAGRDPLTIEGDVFRPDHIIEVRPDGPTSGTIVWEWHVWDHLIQDFDPAQANHGDVANNPQLVDLNYPPETPRAGDWNHVNSVDYDPVHDWIILSPRAQSEVWIIDHSTTTAEAAGHTGGRWGKGGDLLYRWGNPAAHRRGTAVDQQLFHQHAPVMIPPGRPGAGNILVFDNEGGPSGSSAIDELVLPLDSAGNFVIGPNGVYGPPAPTWSFSALSFASPFVSNAERLPNGNTLVCAGAGGLLFEVGLNDQIVWYHQTPHAIVFHSHLVERTLWTDRSTISGTTGGAVQFDLIAGSALAGTTYMLLATASGTSPGTTLNGITLPLNADAFTVASMYLANTPVFAGTWGFLDSLGKARASFVMPPGLGLRDVQLHFAFASMDPSSGNVIATSNATPVRIVQ